jgi:Xaa-Pro aminopeptidase
MHIKDVNQTIADMADCILDGMDMKSLEQFARECLVDNLTAAFKADGENGLITQAEGCGFEITYEEDTDEASNGR